jgi:hypothetical protein
MTDPTAPQTTDPWPWRNRIIAWLGAWALRRLYGCCDPAEFDADCPSCQAGKLAREMEEIARGE